MKAIGIKSHGSDLTLLEVQIPEIGPLDILVQVKAVSVNPVDSMVQSGNFLPSSGPRVLGYDASGIVMKRGHHVDKFKVGDEVYYVGDLTRAGSFAQYQAVDSRLVGLRPMGISHADSAGLPMACLTAWEALIDNMGIPTEKLRNEGKSILIVNAGGGVGSMGVQIAKHVLGLKVVGTASREETVNLVKECGADEVINHRKRLKDELAKVGMKEVDYVFQCHGLDNDYIQQIGEVVKPFGNVVTIMIKGLLDISPFFMKGIKLHLEVAAAKCVYRIDMERQGEILNIVSKLVDHQVLKPTTTKKMKFNLENLKEAEGILEKGRSFGKITLDRVDEF
jgi:zinc-binding alcohol dehydrogenase family protein